MMRNPDNEVRLAFTNALSGIVADGKNVPTCDVIPPISGSQYIILSTQSKQVLNENKCHDGWNCQILIDIVKIYDGAVGSRAIVNQIEEIVMNRTDLLSVRYFDILKVELEFPNDITTRTNTQTIHRKLIRFNLKLVEQ